MSGGIDNVSRVVHIPAEQDHNRIAFGGNEAEHEHILAAAIIALGYGLSKGAFAVQNDLLVFRADEVVDYVGRGGIAPRIAEPLRADKTLDY